MVNIMHAHSPEEQKYIVHNQKEIAQILTDLAQQKTALNVTFNHGHDRCLTTVIEVDAKNHAVYLDIGRDEAFNSRLLASHHVEFSKDDGIRINWISAHLSLVALKDGRALKVALPQNLIRVQRREYFRLPTPVANPVPCRIPVPDDSEPEGYRMLELTLVDASLSGVGAMARDPLDSALVEGASFDNCKISFPNVGETSLTLRVQNIHQVQSKDGSIKHRLGLQYIDPSRGNQGLIQRYTFNLEREAMAVANAK